MAFSLLVNPNGGYRFLPGIAPYSAGAIAEAGYEITHVTLAAWMPWHAGLMAARRFLEQRELTPHALCGVELRCPKPHSFGGFSEFNHQYRAVLEEWDVLVDDVNPVARTNVAPVVNPPDETVLHAFSYVEPSRVTQPTFVVAGGGELPHRELLREHIVCLGNTSDDAMIEKARCVVRIMKHRLEKLGAPDSAVSEIDVYTAHALRKPLTEVIIPALPGAASAGIHWFYSRPPVEDIEFEMDLRGVRRELQLDPAAI